MMKSKKGMFALLALATVCIISIVRIVVDFCYRMEFISPLMLLLNILNAMIWLTAFAVNWLRYGRKKDK